MALTTEKDQYGNIWDDAGYWVGVGANAGQIYINGQWMPNPNGISFGGSTSGGGITYEWVTSDGSDGFPAGTTYQLGSNGSRSNIKYPSTSSGGGGSVSVSLNPNSTSAWSIKEIGGKLYRLNELTGEVVPLEVPGGYASNSNDLDGDGYDDSTGLPNGVIKVSTAISPTGLVYKGVPVNADGSPYTGGTGGGAPDAPTWTGYGPKGQGTYYLDGPGGTPGTYIGATTAAGAGLGSSSSGSNAASSTVRVSGISSSGGSGGGGGGSGGFNGADYRAQTQAMLEREAALQTLKAQYREPDTVSAEGSANRAFQAQENALDRAMRLAESAAARRVQNIRDLESAVSSVDMGRLNARRLALGPGTTTEGLLQDTPGGFQYNDAAAALLAEIRGTPGASPVGQGPLAGLDLGGAAAAPGTPGVTPIGGGGGGGTAAVGVGIGAPTGRDAAPAPVATPAPVTPVMPKFQMPKLLGNWQLIGDPTSGQASWRDANTGGIMPWVPGETDGPLDWNAVGTASGNGETGWSAPAEGSPFRNGNWVRLEVGGVPVGWVNAATRERREYSANDPSGSQFVIDDAIAGGPKTAGQSLLNNIYTGADGVQRIINSGGGQYVLGPDGQWMMVGGEEDAALPQNVYSLAQANALAGPGINALGLPSTGTYSGLDALGQKSGISSQTANPYLGGYTGPGSIPNVMDYGNDNIQKELPYSTVVPGLNEGGRATMAVVGEGGGSKPLGSSELVIAPGGMRVIPLTSRRAAALMGNGVPGFNDGYDRRQDAPITDTRSQIAPTQPVAPIQTVTQPVPAPITQPVAVQPVSVGTDTPVATPMPTTTTQPAATPIQPAPAEAPRTEVAQPTPAPVTSGGTAVPVVNQPTPANPSALTPDALALLDEIAQLRWNSPLADVNVMDAAFLREDPSFQQGVFAGKQTKYGFPQGDTAAQVQRFMLRGAPRATAIGY